MKQEIRKDEFNMYRLKAEGITAGYGKRNILQGMDIAVPENKISVILGANACGKSTLLKVISRLLRPEGGSVRLDGKKLSSIPSRHLARALGLLPQSPVVPEGITVVDLVSRGRFPHQSLWGGMKKQDYKAVEEALEIMGIEELSSCPVDELSGGQRQRVWIAMALAQETDILLLDEPTTYLDITHQVEILDLLTDLNRKRGTTIVMILHDINLSARYADYIFAVKDGQLIAQGSPKEVITQEMIHQVYGLECKVMEDPIFGAPMIVPMGRHFV